MSSVLFPGLTAHVNPAWPPGERDLLSRIAHLLGTGAAESALAALPESRSPWVRNARGVCLLRLGRPAQAVEVLRGLVFARHGLSVRPNVHPVFAANYATALLLDGNPDGFHGILSSVRDRSHPAVTRLDDAVWRWKVGMTFWQRVASIFGVGGPPLVIDFPPGEL
ncbi:tetratricopeptide repeat protein [Frigoriglobus tundricola]|uniref:Uncharacterized protein n=1 Tax=Frigoriglobus tundricola TaxID=2774151 RepID=A0A6M5YNM4_9BACT|nr:hypothetical protein [Frigoriglobus tundricola]QJW94562.1 hypothetical protein FTUN_2083 [Frigoriglobus tundricola]